MPDRSALFAIVLAAGGSSRLGSPKQLLTVAGETLIRRALARANHLCGDRVLLVLGAHWQAVLAGAGGLRGFFTVNEEWAEGLSGSLTLGIGAVPEDCEAALVLLADQPLVDDEDLARLATAWQARPGTIAACRYEGSLGVPAIFPRSLFPELRRLQGDRGAKAIIAARADDLTAVDCEHAGCDIDTPADVARLEREIGGGG